MNIYRYEEEKHCNDREFYSDGIADSRSGRILHIKMGF